MNNEEVILEVKNLCKYFPVKKGAFAKKVMLRQWIMYLSKLTKGKP